MLGLRGDNALDAMLDEVIPWTPRRSARGRSSVAWACRSGLCWTCCWSGTRFLFTTPEYEDADMAANSILIEQARRFTLLVGNYRVSISTIQDWLPVRAGWGESLFYNALHVVPAPWNGQLIALYALNALSPRAWWPSATATRSVRATVGPIAVVLLFAALHRRCQLGLDAVPYIPAYRLRCRCRLGGGGSYAGTRGSPALAGWFLINGHALLPALRPGAGAAFACGGRVSAVERKSASMERAVFPRPAPGSGGAGRRPSARSSRSRWSASSRCTGGELR